MKAAVRSILPLPLHPLPCFLFPPSLLPVQMAVNVQSNYAPRKVTVGAPNGAYKYPWNPAVDFTQWGANNPVYIGDSLGE